MTDTYHNTHVLGVAMHPARHAELDLRLEEMVYRTTRKALDDAQVTQPQLDGIVLASSDELDGRPISSMLMAMPAGGYLTDEIKVTDSGAMALCLAYARIKSGDFDLVGVSSWCKSSKTDLEAVSRLRGDPFYAREIGLGNAVTDGLYAGAIKQKLAITEQEVASRVQQAYRAAARNSRGVRHAVPSLEEILDSEVQAAPLRALHKAPMTDGAVSMVLASDRFLKANPHCRPIAKMIGAGWASDRYQLGSSRLTQHASVKSAFAMLLKNSRYQSIADFDVLELESPTGWHEVALRRVLQIDAGRPVSPSGGAFAQNPVFCTGLVNAAEAILQVAGRAGEVQVGNARFALAHSSHGFAQQGNVFLAFEKAENRE